MQRWLILAGGVLVQLVIGGVYAWSVFAKALGPALGLSPVQVAIPFEVAIGMIFVGTSLGGRLQDRRGPRVVAVVGVVLYAAGALVSSLARTGADLWLLVAGYGVLGGFGLGMAYIVPIALLQKWFPDRAALATGLAVAGFGFGAVVTAPIAQALIAAGPGAPARAFGPLGAGYLVAGLVGAASLANPPAGAVGVPDLEGATVAEALRTPRWYVLTATLMVAVLAGISLISVAAGAAVDVGGLTPEQAAAAVGVLGLFNGAGRIAWAAASEKLGKLTTFVAILVLEGAALLALPHARHPAAFLALAAVVYLCYGGAFGTMPSTAGRIFGVRHAGAIYGLMLIGWSVGGVLGPLVAASLLGLGYGVALSVVGVVALLGAGLPLLARVGGSPGERRR